MTRPAFASQRTTRWLAACVAVALATTLAASARLGSTRAAASASARDLAACEADLRDLAQWHATTRTGDDAAAASDPELNRRVRAAATAAQLVDQLVSIEPGPPIRARDSDLVRTPIYLRLDGATVRQVVTFVHALTADDASLRATGIELSAPPMTVEASSKGDERWTVDMTLSESTLGPPAERPR